MFASLVNRVTAGSARSAARNVGTRSARHTATCAGTTSSNRPVTRHLAARLSNWRTGATAWDSNPRLCVIIPMAGGVLAALIVPRFWP